MACHERAKRVEWRGTKGFRTSTDRPFKFKVTNGKVFIYKVIGQQARELRQQGLSWVKVARKLGVSDKTAKKASCGQLIE